jgi:hypothetical protein
MISRFSRFCLVCLFLISITPACGSHRIDTVPSTGYTQEIAVTATASAQEVVPLLRDCTDYAGFVMDVTVPDGTIFSPGQAFTKTWRLVNAGSCTWTEHYTLTFRGGEQMGGPDSQKFLSSIVSPGTEVDVSVNLIAPSIAGEYTGYWTIYNENGEGVEVGGYESIWVKIKVANSVGLENTSQQHLH